MVLRVKEVEEDIEEAEVEVQMAPPLNIILMVAMNREKIQILDEAINIKEECVE